MTSTARPEPIADFGTELIREWIPGAETRGIIVLVHGIAEHSGRYERTGSLLADAGFRVRSFDLIGAGASGGDRWDIDEWSRYHDQIGRHVEWGRGEGLPVILMGHSLGGNLALGYALSKRIAPDLLVLSAPALAAGAPWQRAIAPFAARIIPRVAIPNYVKGEALSRDPAVAAAYFADPLVITKSTPRFGMEFLTSIEDLKLRIGDLDIPTLVLHGGSDTIVPPTSTAAMGELEGVERRLYPGLRHEILNEPEGPEIVAEIVEWIAQRI